MVNSPRKNDILIPAIDICLLLIITMVLCIASIRYSTKGSGEKSYATIDGAEVDTKRFLARPHEPFTAVLVSPYYIETYSITDHKKGNERTYFSIKDFEPNIKSDHSYVIYEEKKSQLLADVIRSLIKARVVKVQIARMSK